MSVRARAGMAVFLLACLGALVFAPPTLAQPETVGGFLLKIARAAGLTATTPSDAIQALIQKKLISATVGDSLAPQVGFALTRGQLAQIMNNILHLEPQLAGAGPQDVVNALAQRGIIPPGPAASVVTSEEVTTIMTNPTVAASFSAAAAAAPAVAVAAAVPAAVLPIAVGLAAAAVVAARSFHAASP